MSYESPISLEIPQKIKKNNIVYHAHPGDNCTKFGDPNSIIPDTHLISGFPLGYFEWGGIFEKFPPHSPP